jgi:hypothetical protein
MVIALGAVSSLIAEIIVIIFKTYVQIYKWINIHEQTFQLFILISIFAVGIILFILTFFWLVKKDKNRLLQKAIPVILFFCGVMLIFNSLHIVFIQPQQKELNAPPDLNPEVPREQELTDKQTMAEESKEMSEQRSPEHIRSDPVVAPSPISHRSAALSFVGDTLAARDRHSVTASLRDSMQTWNVALDLDEDSSDSAGYNFTVTVYHNQAPANSILLQAEVTVVFSRGGRVLCQTGPYYITEITESMVAYRIAEWIKGEESFFGKVNETMR